MIRISQAARRYGHALYSLAKESNSEELILRDLSTLTKLLLDHRFLRVTLRNPLIKVTETHGVIESFSKTLKFHETTETFLKVLASQRRLNEVKGIYEAFKEEFKRDRVELQADVISPFDLSKKHIDRLRSILKGKTGHSIDIKVSVDPSLIGGLVVQMGSIVVDTSVRTRMTKLRNVLERVA